MSGPILFVLLLLSACTVPAPPTDSPADTDSLTSSSDTSSSGADADTDANSDADESTANESEMSQSEEAEEPSTTQEAVNPPPFPIQLPPGFRIDLFATDVPNARSMALSPNGTLFVGTRRAGKFYAVLDHDQDHQADEVIELGSNMFMPNGVAFRDGSLYVAEVNRILRYDNIEADLHNPPEPVVVNDSYPSDSWHGWKFIRFGPDGMLYVPVGGPCNVCENDGTLYGSITRMNPDGSGVEIYAHGVRNSVGFDWQPSTDQLWFTDNGRDHLGDDLPRMS